MRKVRDICGQKIGGGIGGIIQLVVGTCPLPSYREGLYEVGRKLIKYW
jgi:hypothetical protein